MLLEVANLSIDLPTQDGVRRIVRQASFTLERGQTLGIVGESGSGKTMTALALLGLLPTGATVSGSIGFEGRDLTKLSEAQMQDLRGDGIAMIFQEPMTALNPLHSIGSQIAEPLILHRGLSRAAAHAEAVKLLQRVGMPDRERINAAFLPMAIASGLTSAITNPLAADVKAAIMAADVLMGNDQDATRWIRAHRDAVAALAPATLAPAAVLAVVAGNRPRLNRRAMAAAAAMRDAGTSGRNGTQG